MNEIISSGSSEMLKRWLNSGNSINTTNADGETPIQLAALEGDMPMVLTCLELGATTDGVREILEKVASFSFLEDLEDKRLL